MFQAGLKYGKTEKENGKRCENDGLDFYTNRICRLEKTEQE